MRKRYFPGVVIFGSVLFQFATSSKVHCDPVLVAGPILNQSPSPSYNSKDYPSGTFVRKLDPTVNYRLTYVSPPTSQETTRPVRDRPNRLGIRMSQSMSL